MRSAETAADVNENHRNSAYLGDDAVLPDALRATTDFAEAANCADVIVMGVPSHGFRSVLTELAKELREHVRKEVGPIAMPSKIEFTPTLPKTRSGKIMRRLLKNQIMGLPTGDISTLEG